LLVSWRAIVFKTLKTAGKSAGEIARQTVADLDATWGKGFFNGDVFAQVGVFGALSRDAQRGKRRGRSAVRPLSRTN